jgi:hypothetical protein
VKVVFVILLYVVAVVLLWYGHIVGGMLLAFVAFLINRGRIVR